MKQRGGTVLFEKDGYNSELRKRLTLNLKILKLY